MKKEKNLKLNIIFNAIYQVLVLLVPFITSPYVSRVLLPEGVGSYSFSYSIVYYFVLFATFGLLDYGTVVISQNRDSKEEYSRLFWEISIFKFFITLFTLGLYFLLVMTNCFANSAYPLSTKLVYLIMGMDIFAVGFDITFLLQGLEKFVSLAVRNLLVKVLNLILILTLVKSKDDFLIYVIIMSGCLLLSALSTLPVILRNIQKPNLKGGIHLGYHFRKSLVYFVPYVCTGIYTVANKTILGSYEKDPVISGYYESADKLIGIVTTLVNSINTIMLSRMSYLYATNNQKEIQRKTNKTFEVYLLMALPAFAGLLCINNYFTPGFFGEDFSASVPLVYILSGKIILVPISGILGSIYYVPKGKLWSRNLFLFVGSATNLLLSFLLIRFQGITGAAIAALLTEVVVSFLYLFFARKDLHFKESKEPFIKCMGSSMLMASLLCVLNPFLEPLGNIKASLVLIVSGVILYFACLLLFKEKMMTEFSAKLISRIRKKKE